jgi:hypothetical protein
MLKNPPEPFSRVEENPPEPFFPRQTMQCQNCGARLREGADHCPACGITLLQASPEPTREGEVELVNVFETRDPGLILVIKSLLDGEEIDYLVRGDPGENPLAWRHTGGLFGIGVKPAVVVVRAEDAERVRALLESMGSG